MALRQTQQLKLLQKLSPQQIQLMKLLQLPTVALEQRIKEELELNPALEEDLNDLDTDNDESDYDEVDSSDDTEINDYEEKEIDKIDDGYELEDYMDAGDLDAYKYEISNRSADDEIFQAVAVEGPDFHSQLEEQLGLQDITETQYTTGLYLIGCIDAKMTEADLQKWVQLAVSANISEYTVPWVCAGSKHGMSLATQWINDEQEHVATAGWATLCSILALKPNSEIDSALIKKLITRIEKNIHTEKNRVKYWMNNFIISVGVYSEELNALAIVSAQKNGDIKVEMNGTACKVPNAIDYINKVKSKGTIGKKKKTVKC